MPWGQVLFRPGINTQLTQVLNERGWSISNLIRFRDGLTEKNGGWARLSDEALVGTARGINVWSDLSSLPYLATGSEQRLQVFSLGGISDITPLTATTNPAVNFSTVNLSTTVTIVDAGHSPAVDDWVRVLIPVSVGGIVLHGLYQVTTVGVPGPTAFTIVSATPATATINNAGAVPLYTVQNGFPTVTVTLNNHGYALGEIYTNEVAKTIATVVIGAFSQWAVASVVDPNNFTFTANSNANANVASSVNGGNARLEYLVPTGYANADLLMGFGVGLFSAGYFGISGSGLNYTIIRQWFLDQWGQDLIGNYPRSPIFVWVPPVALGNYALAINAANFPASTTPPATVNASFTSIQQQIFIALGCDPTGGGSQDPNLIRWCDVADFTQWTPTATNQAGSYRIPTGSRIIGGIAGSTFNVVWTDEDMWTFNYIGFPLVFGFNRVAGGSGMISGRCCAIAGGIVYWVAYNAIYKFDGSSVSIVPCSVWDILWKNLDTIQIDKCHLAVNSDFQELIVYFPSLTGDGEVDSYIRLNWRENLWDYGSTSELFARTCFHDRSVFGPPVGVDLNGLIQQHEIASDADGQQMGEFVESGYFAIQEGWLFTTITQMVADFKFNSSAAAVSFWVLGLNYPTDTPVTFGPFTHMLTSQEFDVINSRARMVAVRVGFSTVGSTWRAGNTRYLYLQDGSI